MLNSLFTVARNRHGRRQRGPSPRPLQAPFSHLGTIKKGAPFQSAFIAINSESDRHFPLVWQVISVSPTRLPAALHDTVMTLDFATGLTAAVAMTPGF